MKRMTKQTVCELPSFPKHTAMSEPRWLNRPNEPGWWLVIPSKRGVDCASALGDKLANVLANGIREYISLEDLVGHPWDGVKQCYGPIPIPPDRQESR